MYQLVSAIARSNAPGARWVSLDIGSVMLGDLFSKYEKVYAVLTNSFYTGQKTFDLDDANAFDPNPTLTFNDFLTNLGTQSLPLEDYTYSVKTSYAGFTDGFKANYKIQPISPLGHIGSNIAPADRDWLSVIRTDTDMTAFFQHCLISVNGFIHRTDGDGVRAYVIDGMKSCRKSGLNCLGITSFTKLGALEFVSLTPDMIYHRNDDQGNLTPYKSRMYIDAGSPRPTKTAMLVLGGYLHILDPNTFSQVGDQTFCINFQNFPLRDRYFDSFKMIDLDVLGLDHQSSNPVRIDDAELHSDEVLVKYATLSQSFLVFVDNPHLFVEREGLPRSRLYNTYTSAVKPEWPLIVQAGKFSDYWSVFEDDQWAITNKDGRRNNYDYNTTLEDNIVCIDDARTPQDRTTLSLAHFLKIGTDQLIQSGA